MRLLRWWPRQYGKRRVLGLVEQELADLEKRSQEAAEARKPQGLGYEYYDRMIEAHGGWCAPTEPVYGLLDLPTVSVKRGGLAR